MKEQYADSIVTKILDYKSNWPYRLSAEQWTSCTHVLEHGTEERPLRVYWTHLRLG